MEEISWWGGLLTTRTKLNLISVLLAVGSLVLSGSVSPPSLPLERVMVMYGVAKRVWRKERLSRRATTDTIGTRILVALPSGSPIRK